MDGSGKRFETTTAENLVAILLARCGDRIGFSRESLIPTFIRALQRGLDKEIVSFWFGEESRNEVLEAINELAYRGLLVRKNGPTRELGKICISCFISKQVQSQGTLIDNPVYYQLVKKKHPPGFEVIVRTNNTPSKG